MMRYRRRMSRARVAWVFAWLHLGCSDGSYMDDIPPSGHTDGTTGTGTGASMGTDGGTGTGAGPSTSTGGDRDQCKSTVECGDGLVCAADFEGDDRGPYACVPDCIGIMDEARWCADAGACCDPAATCTDRGYCIADGSSTGTSTGTTSG